MTKTKKPPAVRIAKPAGRPIQLRYLDAETGREVRISTGTLDDDDAEAAKERLEAKLLLGIDAKPRRRQRSGPTMLWEVFREQYTDLQLSTLKSAVDAESRLDVIERILKPKTLADIANAEALADLQQKLLAGAERRKPHVGKPRSPHTVRTTMAVLMADLRWAEFMDWLPAVPRVKRLKTTKLRNMKGRPITGEEFDRLLAAVPAVVGKAAAESWEHTLRGLWESGLRLGELLHVHWADDRYIVPAWSRGALPVLRIPAAMQKNATEEAIPLLPGFEGLLQETPEADRAGWAFNPLCLDERRPGDKRLRLTRVTLEWAGKVICRIGKKAGVVVQPAADGGSAKFASAHDLRRSCADRLVAAGVPEREVAAIMRHASVETTRRHYAPGSVQRSAGVIREKLGVPRYSLAVEST